MFLGIDPGLVSGAMAVLDLSGARPRLVAVADVPSIGDGAKKRVDVLAIMAFIQKHNPSQAAIERAQAMPDQGASSGFSYGRAVGALEACLVGCMISHFTVEPSAWKRAHGLIGQDKEGSRQRALSLFPEGHQWLARKKDHNRGEAALIAHFGAMIVRNGHEAAPKTSRALRG